MALLDLKYTHTDFLKHIYPYTKNGIIIDTSVMKVFLDGLIKIKFSKQPDNDFDNLVSFLQIIKADNQWNKFLITPHIFTEICSHLHKDHNKKQNYKEIVCEILPILGEIQEHCDLNKKNIVDCIDLRNPILEIGDISIFLTADGLTANNKKIAVLAKDRGIKNRFESNPYILIMDLDTAIKDLKQARI